MTIMGRNAGFEHKLRNSNSQPAFVQEKTATEITKPKMETKWNNANIYVGKTVDSFSMSVPVQKLKN